MEFFDSSNEILRGLKLGIEKCGHEITSQPWADDLRSNAQHVNVVVFDGLMSRMNVMADSSSYAADFVCRYRGANSSAANE